MRRWIGVLLIKPNKNRGVKLPPRKELITVLKTKRLTIAEIKEEIRTIDRFRIVIKDEKNQLNG